MKTNRFTTITGIIMMLLYLTSCIKVYDDLDACLAGHIRITYKADGNENILNSKDQSYIEGVDLYIYEKETGRLTDKPTHYGKDQLKGLLTLRFPKENTYYKVVAVANLHKDTKDKFEDETNYKEAVLSARDESGVSRLYLGEKEIHTEGLWEKEEEIELKSIHTRYTATIEVAGETRLGEGWYEDMNKEGDITVRLTKLPANHHLAKPHNDMQKSIAEMPFKMEDGEIKTEFNSLRINEADKIGIQLLHNGQPIESTTGACDFSDVVAYINKYNEHLPEEQKIDIKKQEYTIPLKFRVTLSANVIIDITLEPWKEIDVKPQL